MAGGVTKDSMCTQKTRITDGNLNYLLLLFFVKQNIDFEDLNAKHT